LAVKVHHVDHGQVARVEMQTAKVVEAVGLAARLGGLVEVKGSLAVCGEDGGK
jgi:hypothetical protein